MATQQQGADGRQVRQENETQSARQREQAATRPAGTSQQQAGAESSPRQMGSTRITDWASI